MKTTLIIADDEYFIRQRLKRIIPFTALNLTLIGEAENGVEVLNILHEQHVDIVLLDIHMPKMPGTEVALHIHHNFPETQVIILSGYNEFEYARSALQNGVYDYLLKPVDSSVLLSSLEKCMEKVAQRKQADAKIWSFDQHMRSKAMTDIREGKLSFSKFYQQYPEFSQYKYSTYIGVYTEEETPTCILNLADCIRRKLSLYCDHFRESEHIYCLQLFFRTDSDISNLKSFLTEYIDHTKSYIFLTMDQAFPLEENWEPFYRIVLSCLNQRYFSPSSGLLMEFKSQDHENEKIALVELRQTVLKYLNLGDFQNFENFIEASFETLVQKKNINLLFSFFNELFITYQIHYKIPKKLDSSIADFISTVIEEEYACNKLKEVILHYGSQCMSLKKVQPSDISYCKKIMMYIEENYKDPELTVSSIAEHFQLNASYLGTMFKNVRDQSILQYITKVRMDQAKQLLSTGNHLVSEIATAIGYSDVFYFSKCFKKNFGCSPKEFIHISDSESLNT
ncbi:MAG: response regulator [Suilimivivens sp.]